MTSQLQQLIDQLEGPAVKKTMDELVDMCRNGHDDNGHRVVDKFFDIHTAMVYVELPNGKRRCYSERL